MVGNHTNLGALERVEVWLQKMKDLAAEYPHLEPSVFTYNACMEAYTRHIQVTQNDKRRSKTKENRQIILQSRDSILRLYEELEGHGLIPNSYTRNLLLESMPAQSKMWKASEKWAISYLDGRQSSTVQGNPPNRRTFNLLFSVYGHERNFHIADVLLKKLWKWNFEHWNGNFESNSLVPSKLWYQSLLTTLSKSNIADNQATRDAMAIRCKI